VINYVWIGLLLLAIGYGAYLDITKQPTTKSPAPVSLQRFEEGEAGFRATLVDTPLVTAAPEGKKSAQLTYEMDGGRIAPLDVLLQIEKSDGATALAFNVLGDGSGNLLRARFESAKGDSFFADGGTLGDAKEWRTVSFPLGALTPAPENPTAKPSYPLTLREIAVVQQGVTPSTGTFFLDDARLTFPTTSLVVDSVASDSWMGVLTKSLTRWSGQAVTLALELIGTIMFWLGLMRIAEKAGLVQLLAQAVKPVMVILFPDIPANGEAMGAIVMNVAANMLGLGNAATPLGIKAMEELQKLNPNKEYATNAHCMLLAINTSSITIIAPTIIAYRAGAGSMDVMKFWPVMIAATCMSTLVAVIGCKILERLPMYRIPAAETPAEGANT
jgi:spore maturation protein A